MLREDKKVINNMLGQGDGCNLCTINPRDWSDWDKIQSSPFPPRCDRSYEFNKVSLHKAVSGYDAS